MRRSLKFALWFSLIALPNLSFASLGGSADSIESDGRSLRANHQPGSGQAGYTVHQLSTTTMNIREYVSPDGKIFAVTWRGARRPDLSVLLGSYYQEYSTADANLHRSHGRQSTTVKTTNVVVTRGGHMRDIHGKAYVPSLVPAGVDVGGLQ